MCFKMDALLEKSVQVTEWENMKAEMFKRCFQNQLPVVLKGAVLDWKACTLWRADYLKSALKSSFKYTPVLFSVDNQHFIDHEDLTTKKNMEPEELVDYVFQHEKGEVFPTAEEKDVSHKQKVYLRTSTMPDSLYKDIFTPDQVQSLADKIFLSSSESEFSSIEAFSLKVFKQKTMQLWVGTRGNITQLHYDRNHGLLAQIMGRKQLLLFSHEDTGSLYPFPSHTSKAHVSKVNLRQLADSIDRFPKFSRAQVYHCVIDRGDLLYIPPFWWHDVTSLDNCVSVTLPWDISANEEIPPCMLR